MIELNTTWNTVVMLMVAGGVGLIGGIGAALIEWKSKQTIPSPNPATAQTAAVAAASGAAAPPPVSTATPSSGSECGRGFLNVLTCVVLGGIAAVAILYFFPPIKEVVEPGDNGKTVTTTFYDLIKLVTLSLIVGSAGTTVLQALQAKALNSVNEQKVGAVAATSGAGTSNLVRSAPEFTSDNLKANTDALAEVLRQGKSVSEKQSKELAKEAISMLADEVPKAVAVDLQKQADNFNQAITAVVTGEPVPPQPA
jgi:hypothetical protein